MYSLTYPLFLISVLAPAHFVSAFNDWSIPCVSGSCSWDTGDGKTTAYSSMTIGGSNTLISDITPAAGWNIQGCDPNWANGSHTVQMTCSGPSNSTQYCGHVYEGGAENTIVRLPENCGRGPFARIVSATNKTDSIARRIANPNANTTISGTQTLVLNYNFSQIPTSRGKATFAVTSSNLKGQSGVSTRELDALRGRGRAGELHRRRFASLSRRFDQTLNSGQLTPVNFNQDVTLFDQSISCSSGGVSGNAELKIDVAGQVDITVSFSATVVGTLAPPQISDFSVNANLGGNANATFTVNAVADGTFDTGSVPLLTPQGLPGLSIPSVITLGPQVSINGQLTMDLKAEANLAINAGWNFPSVNMVFPQAKGASTGAATVSNTNNPLQLSADPSVDISGTVTGHIIPRVDFGVNLFSGSAQASVFMDADISASLEMEVTASATVDNTNPTAGSAVSPTGATDAATTAPSATDSAAAANSTLADASVNSTDTSGVISATDISSLSTDNPTSVDPLSTSTDTSLSTSTDTSLSTSTDDPLASPTPDPLSTSTDDPLAAPTDDPLATPTDDPLATPTDSSLDTSTDDPLASTTDDPSAVPTDNSVDPSTVNTDTSGFRRRSSPVLDRRATSGSLNGCITVNGAIAINGGLQGSLEPFLNDQETFPIFSKSLQLFQKCLNGPISGSTAQRRSSIVRRAGDTSGLSCPTTGVAAALQSII